MYAAGYPRAARSADDFALVTKTSGSAACPGDWAPTWQPDLLDEIPPPEIVQCRPRAQHGRGVGLRSLALAPDASDKDALARDEAADGFAG
jgi:hypothetical protein